MENVQITRRNPFDYTQPLSRPEDCVGRTVELNRVKKYLEDSRICEVVGGPRIGKTSFLFRLVELGFPVATIPCAQIADEFRKSVSRDVPSMFWTRVTKELGKGVIKLQETQKAQQQQVKVQYEQIASELRALSRVFDDTEVFRPAELHRVGEKLAALGPDEHILLALDDFDELLRPNIMHDTNLAGLLDCLLTLNEASQRKVWLVFASKAGLTESLVERRKSMDAESKARFDRPFGDFQRYLAAPIVLMNLSEEEIKELGERVPEFPPYVSREVFRESGGHPFLAQALYYYAYLESANGNPPIRWGNALEAMRQDGLVVGFLRELQSQLSREERELLRIAMGTASNAQKRAIRQGSLKRGQLPESFSRLPSVLKCLPWGRVDTSDKMRNLVNNPSLMGLVFREATEEERQQVRPYLIWVGNGPRQYVVGARFVWRAFRKGIPKLPVMRRWRIYSDITLIRLSVTLLFVILILMLVLPWVDVPSRWAFILGIVPLAYLVYGYYVEKRRR